MTALLIKKFTALILLPAVVIFQAFLVLVLVSLTGVVERALTEAGSAITGGILRVDRVLIEPFGGIHIRGPVLRVAGESRPIVRARSLVLHYSAASLLAGNPFPQEIVLEQPVLWLPRDLSVLRTAPEEAEGEREPITFPTLAIAIRNGSFEMEGWDIKIRGVNASLKTLEESLILEESTARLAGGTLRLEGVVRGGENPETRFKVAGEKILCSPALEPFMQKIGALNEYRAFKPDGLADFAFESDPITDWKNVGGRLSLTPRSTSLTFLGFPDGTTGSYSGGLPYPLEDVEGSIEIRIPGQVVIETAEGSMGPGRFNVEGRIVSLSDLKELNIVFEGRNIDLDRQLYQAIEEQVPEVIEVLRQLEVRGRADVSVSMESSSRHERTASTARDEYSVTAVMRGASICPEFFPLTVEEIRGPVLYKGGTCSFQGIRGMLGRTVIYGKGNIGPKEIRLDLRAEPLVLDQSILDALHGAFPEVAEMVESLGITGGVMNVRFDYEDDSRSRDRGSERVAMRFLVELDGCSARPGAFPLALDNINGTVLVQVSPSGIEEIVTEDLTGSHAGSVLQASVHIRGPDLEIAKVEITVHNQALTPELLAVLSEHDPGLKKALDDLSLEGFFGARFKKEAGSDDLFLQITPNGCSAHPVFFPVSLENLRGTVTVAIGSSGLMTVEMLDVSGSHEGSTLYASGLLEGPELELKRVEVTGRNQNLSDEIKNALCEMEPQLRDYIGGLTAVGNIDFKCTLDDKGMVLSLNPRLTSIDVASTDGGQKPLPFSSIHGSLTWQSASRRLQIDDLSTRMREGIFIVEEGEVSWEEDQVFVVLRGSGQGLRLDEDLDRILKERTLETWNFMGVSGLVNLSRAEISARIAESHLQELRVKGDVYFEGASISAPISLTEIFGPVAVETRSPARNGGAFEMEVLTKNLAFELREREYSNISSRFLIDDRSLRIVELEGNHFGGAITAGKDAFSMDFAPPQPFSANLEGKGADLRRFIGNSGYATKDIAGRLDWTLSCRGEMADIRTVQAEGRMSVEDGHLWKLPVFSSLLEVIGGMFGFSNLPVFERGSARFKVDKGIATIEDAVLYSPLLKLQGEGNLTADGANVQVRFSVGPKIPIIGDIIAPVMNLIKKGIFNLRVRGNYDSMEVFYDPIVTSPFRSTAIDETGRIPPRRKYTLFGRF